MELVSFFMGRFQAARFDAKQAETTHTLNHTPGFVVLEGGKVPDFEEMGKC